MKGQLGLWDESDAVPIINAATEASAIENARRIAVEEAAARVCATRKGDRVDPHELDELEATLLEAGRGA